MPWAEVEGRAADLRAELRLGDEPVPDILNILEQIGLAVFVQPLGQDGPDGAYLPRERIKVVLLNGDRYLARLRFTAAHELGHHIFADGARLDERLFPPSSAVDLAEQRANGFAAAFLMPESGIAARLGLLQGQITPDQVLRLATEFEVSYEALVNRLQNLRRISSADRARLLAERAAVLTSEFRERRLPTYERLPGDYVRRALQAYEDAKISFDRLADLLRAESHDERLELARMLHEQEFLDPEDARELGLPAREPRAEQAQPA
jgi:Zn-dependent peptidase ImmA (M78 family)